MRNKPVRVLHVLGSLGLGGAETWTVQILERLDPRRVQADVLVHQRGGAYEERVCACGAVILTCESLRWPLVSQLSLQRLFQEHGPYQVVHSHLQFYSGVVLRAAHRAGVPGRIAHARNSADGKKDTPWRIAYRIVMRRWIWRYATHMLAVSRAAAEGVFGKTVVANGRCRLLTGIDFSPFRAEVDRDQVRAELGISAGTLVVGHVGSFRQQKNHWFLLDIARHLVEFRPDACLLLIGEGERRPALEEAVRSRNLTSAVRFLGERNDVPRLLRAMDVFVFPSLYEGLPRALVEAQAAGLPCIASNRITTEVAAGQDSICFLPLEAGPRVWAQALAHTAQQPASPSRGAEAIRKFEARGLGIASNVLELTDLYENIANTGCS